MTTDWSKYLAPEITAIMQTDPQSTVARLCKGVTAAADKYITQHKVSPHLAHLAAVQAADKCATAYFG